MNREPDSTVQRDLFATAAASLRRKTRFRRQTFWTLSLAAFIGALTFITIRPDPSPGLIAPAASVPAATPGPVPTEPGPPYDTLSTDEELLAALADQGPMLIIHPDGRKQLILTRP